ncbi:ABC transporter permease [Paralcaligenes ureilyticus]|uniref:Putative spermidine/putrescine transport system permease protein/spermidine/putrescine transport system permease protein n=1 Tax=Paralcaligenes ureilyticus TaxID=627131 RepID=A0A4R3MBX2_9BURK|nr:ABC transporter permease [Paralcaligenes ureilyticus]TCT08955.1 putative spermidine/putrescine transport system permease protein/spermidine/putrescine transport system permease protein [Paralcaligenes ureilyticus]
MNDLVLRPQKDSIFLKNENLIYPVLFFLLVFFICPIIWFFIKAALDYDGSFAVKLYQTFTSSVFITVAWKTVWISLLVTVLALLGAYPIAYTLSRASSVSFTLIIISVIVPYFTSIIVRTYSWMIILGTHGIVNRFLISVGLIDKPITLMYNMLGVVIGMTYVLLPYFVLTLYSSMKSIDHWLIQAGRSMGASNFYVFRKIFLPLSMPGVISGFLIVYILAVGFFITPALMGGPKDVMMAMLIQRNIEITMDWPLASALSLVLLAITLIIYVVYCKYTDLDKMLGK